MRLWDFAEIWPEAKARISVVWYGMVWKVWLVRYPNYLSIEYAGPDLGGVVVDGVLHKGRHSRQFRLKRQGVIYRHIITWYCIDFSSE